MRRRTMSDMDTHAPPVIARRIGFHNLRNTMTATKLAVAHRAMRDADVHAYGTSENNHRDAAAHVPAGYVTLQGARGWHAGTAIHYRPDVLELLRWANPVLHVSRLFPSASRAFVWATFRDKGTGRWLTVVVVHFVPHADDPNDPGDLTELPRRELVVKALTVLTAFAWTVRGQLVVVGDFNTDLAADLEHADADAVAETLARANLLPVPALLGERPFPTHGRNVYDQAYVKTPRRKRRRTLRPRWMKRTSKDGSDHYGIVVEFTSRVKRGLR